MYSALGFLELNSIAGGIEACDEMLKVASVELIESHPICPGKYMTLICGDVDAVKTSISKGKEVASINLVDDFVIPNIHEQIVPALRALTSVVHLEAVGVVETFSAASAIFAADAALKAAAVDMIEIRLSNGMGGKSFFTFTGIVGAVEASVKAAKEAVVQDGLLVNTVVIPSPHESMKSVLI